LRNPSFKYDNSYQKREEKISNLTIRMKLTLSFSVFGIGKSADGFTSYREMARDSVLAGRVQANS